MPSALTASAPEFDHSGIQLIEREEEVSIFYEKIDIQEKLKLDGEMEIHILEEKIRFLKLKIAEKHRQIHVSQKLLPAKQALDQELAVLQIQVGQRAGTGPRPPCFLLPYSALEYTSLEPVPAPQSSKARFAWHKSVVDACWKELEDHLALGLIPGPLCHGAYCFSTCNRA